MELKIKVVGERQENKNNFTQKKSKVVDMTFRERIKKNRKISLDRRKNHRPWRRCLVVITVRKQISLTPRRIKKKKFNKGKNQWHWAIQFFPLIFPFSFKPELTMINDSMCFFHVFFSFGRVFHRIKRIFIFCCSWKDSVYCRKSFCTFQSSVEPLTFLVLIVYLGMFSNECAWSVREFQEVFNFRFIDFKISCEYYDYWCTFE